LTWIKAPFCDFLKNTHRFSGGASTSIRVGKESDSFVPNPMIDQRRRRCAGYRFNRGTAVESIRAILAPPDGAGQSAARNRRLGSDKLEYLTDNRAWSRSRPCKAACGHSDDLLRRRMLALELDPDEMALSDPPLFRHLQGCCALCSSPQDCASDLAQASTNRVSEGREDWRDYCENAFALEMLAALRRRSKVSM
jgi:hypothetical protein